MMHESSNEIVERALGCLGEDVRPPPDGVQLVLDAKNRASRARRTRTVAGLTVAAIVALPVVYEFAGGSISMTENPQQRPAIRPAVTPKASTPVGQCQGHVRHIGSPSYSAESKGFSSPRKAMAGFVGSGIGAQPDDQIVVRRRLGRSAVVLLVHSNGDLRARAKLVETPSGGWLLDMITYC